MNDASTRLRNCRQIRVLAFGALLEAYNGRLLATLFVVLLSGFILAQFLGEVAVTESVAIQTGFLAAFLRLAIVFVLAVFVISSSVREICDKTVYLLLSLPLHRSVLFFGKFFGHVLISLFAVSMAGMLLALFAPFAHVVPWMIMLWLESVLVIAFSMMCALSFAQVPLATATVLGFYLLARSMNALLLIAHNPLINNESFGQSILVYIVDMLGFVLPALDRFSSAEIVMYGTGPDFHMAAMLLQGTVYISLLIAAALFDLYRRNF